MALRLQASPSAVCVAAGLRVAAVASAEVALLAGKAEAHPAHPSYRGPDSMVNRPALIVAWRVTQAVGTSRCSPMAT